MAGAWRLLDVGARPGCLAAKKRSGAVAQPVLPKEAPDKVRLDVHEDVQPRGFDILCNRTHERNARDASTQPGRAHQPGQRHVKNSGSDRKLAGDTGDRDDQSETVGQRGTVHSRRQLDVVAISSRVRRRPSWLDRDAMVITVFFSFFSGSPKLYSCVCSAIIHIKSLLLSIMTPNIGPRPEIEC